MVIHETQEINSGLLFHGRRLIGVADGGKIEYKYFVPDRFMYKPVHDNEDNSANDEIDNVFCIELKNRDD
jgi:hypothetical protein